MAIGEITLSGAAQPVLDGPLNVAITLDVAGGWGSVSQAEWKLYPPDNSASVLTVAGPIVAAPFTNTFTADVPGAYLVYLEVVYTDASEDKTRAVFQVQHVALHKDPRNQAGTDEIAAAPAVYETGHDPQFAGASAPPARDATYGWGHALQRALRLQADALEIGQMISVYNGSGLGLSAGDVVRPAAGASHIYTGGAGGAAAVAGKRDYSVDVQIVDGTAMADMGPDQPLYFMMSDVPAGEHGLALVEGELVERDVTATAPPPAGTPVYVDGSGQLYYEIAPATPGGPHELLARQVGIVKQAGTAAAAPPTMGTVWFCGQPRRWEKVAGFHGPTLHHLSALGPGLPSIELFRNADTPERLTYKGICDGGLIANNVWQAYERHVCAAWMSQWCPSDGRALFSVSARANHVNASLDVTITTHAGLVLYTGTAIAAIASGAWSTVSLAHADLDFVTAGIEPLVPGQPFFVKFAVTFGAAAGLGDWVEVRPLIEGPTWE